MKCSRCGNENGSDALFCTSCGTKLDGTNQVVNQNDYNDQLVNGKEKEENKPIPKVELKSDKPTVYLIIYTICMICNFFPLTKSIEELSYYFFMIGLLTISVARIRCDNKLVNKLFIYTLTLFICVILFNIALMALCSYFAKDCNMSG